MLISKLEHQIEMKDLEAGHAVAQDPFHPDLLKEVEEEDTEVKEEEEDLLHFLKMKHDKVGAEVEVLDDGRGKPHLHLLRQALHFPIPVAVKVARCQPKKDKEKNNLYHIHFHRVVTKDLKAGHPVAQDHRERIPKLRKDL